MKPTEARQEKRSSIPLADYCEGRDEMNLVELPLTTISTQFLDGRKTVMISDQVWDKETRQHLPRQLCISGSGRYGLPTAKDDDVLLACLQLSSLQGFQSQEVSFTRYELLKLLRWKDESANYRRLAMSLRRWKGVTLYSERAFYDHAAQSWVNRDFNIFDNLYLYEKTEPKRDKSWFVWNEVLFESFQAGYLKKLDWDLYCRLKSPVAKRLYRLLDKRFYHTRREYVFDLHKLAYDKLGMSRKQATGGVKRELRKGLRELEAVWNLPYLEDEQRFQQVRRGQWNVVFHAPGKKTKPIKPQPNENESSIVRSLTERQVSQTMARKIATTQSAEVIQKLVEWYDWLKKSGKQCGPGLLVKACLSPAEYELPPNFESNRQKQQQAEKLKQRQQKRQAQEEQKAALKRQKQQQIDSQINAYLKNMDTDEKAALQQEALDQIRLLPQLESASTREQFVEYYIRRQIAERYLI